MLGTEQEGQGGATAPGRSGMKSDRWGSKVCGTVGATHSPATSNSTSSTTLRASAASRSSWLASSMVPSSVAMPLMDRTRSPTCSSPHLPTAVAEEEMFHQETRAPCHPLPKPGPCSWSGVTLGSTGTGYVSSGDLSCDPAKGLTLMGLVALQGINRGL